MLSRSGRFHSYVRFVIATVPGAIGTVLLILHLDFLFAVAGIVLPLAKFILAAGNVLPFAALLSSAAAGIVLPLAM